MTVYCSVFVLHSTLYTKYSVLEDDRGQEKCCQVPARPIAKWKKEKMFSATPQKIMQIHITDKQIKKSLTIIGL